MRIRILAIAAGATLSLCVSLAWSAGPTAPKPDDGVIDSGKEEHAHGHQHGGTDGHLPAGREDVRLVGKAAINQDLKDGRVADVGVFGNYAYLGAFFEPKCQKGGVYVVDISDPSDPKQITSSALRTTATSVRAFRRSTSTPPRTRATCSR